MRVSERIDFSRVRVTEGKITINLKEKITLKKSLLPRRVLAQRPKTRGGTLEVPACKDTRNFKNVRNELVVWEVFSIFLN